MLFNSYAYFFLVLLTFFLYYSKHLKNFQIHLLIVASFVFYSYTNPWLLALLVFSIVLNAVVSFQVSKGFKSRAKLWTTLGVLVNLSVLVFFKYTPLIANSVMSNWRTQDGIGHFLAQIPLPIGISFFTFQGISLLIDVYREDHSKHRHLVITNFGQHLMKTAFFKSFFPQLIAGPIVKAHDFYFQIHQKHFRDIRWGVALEYLLMGYFLKIVIADNLKDQTFWISFPYFQTLSSADLVTMLVGYSCQIFADFCGYSLIALGSAELFGYRLIQNFNWPYISKSFSEFWTRWHISLSSFLKEYLYIPLGGNRRGNVRTYINLFIVMFLGGLWHGAAWSYAVWGSAHGLLLIAERLISRKISPLIQWIPKNLLSALKIGFVFTCVTVIWLLFRLPNFSEVVLYLKSIAGNAHLPMGKSRIFLNLMYCTPVFALHVYFFCKETWNVKMPRTLKLLIYSFMLYMLVTNYGTSSEFIYFQF